MAEAALKKTPSRRAISKERRREQLIRATISSVAKRGFAGTTMADVTKEAGLSLGIINLHFQSKDKLMVETLKYLAEEYEAAYQHALRESDPAPAQKLAALIELDFSLTVCDRKKLAVWFAFWGEAKSRPTYLKVCAEHDDKYTGMMAQLCEQIIEEGEYKNIKALPFATGLAAMVDGLWLDLLMTPDAMGRDAAQEICFSFLANAFPNHFNY